MLDLLVSSGARIYWSQGIRSEFVGVLRRDFDLTEQEQDEKRSYVERICVLVELPGIIPRICTDPDDDHVLACARSADAEFLVTYDKALLEIGRYGRTRIATPESLLALLR